MFKFKKLVISILSCLSICCAAAGVMSAGTVTVDAAAHKHVYASEETMEVKKEATCTQRGYGYVQCTVDDCTKTKTVWIAATGHSGSENGEIIKVVREASCKATGSIRYACGDCGKTVLETVAKLDHELGEWVVTKEATCTAAGRMTAKCSKCKKTVTETVAKLGHEYSEAEVTKEATCTTAGKQTAKCTRCNRTVTETLPKLGHEFGDWVVTDPTCTTAGKKVSECTRCDKSKTESIAKLGHNLVKAAKVEATCEEDGHYAYTYCDREGCDYTTHSEYRVIKAKGHKWIAYGDPACMVGGYVDHERCGVCDAIRLDGVIGEYDEETLTRDESEVEAHSYNQFGKCVCGESLKNYVAVGNVAYSTIEEALAETKGDITVILSAGTYAIPKTVAGRNITFVGAGEDTVVDAKKQYNISGANLTFENLMIQGTTKSYTGFIHGGDVVYKNCTIDGIITLYGNSATFEGCTFTGTGYLWTYSAKNVLFDGCVFNKTDSRAVLVYNEGHSNVESVVLNNCEFNADKPGYTGSGDWTAAVEIDSSLMKAVVNVVIDGCGADENYSNIVRIKKGNNAKVVVNGKVVFVKPEANVEILKGEIEAVTIYDLSSFSATGESAIMETAYVFSAVESVKEAQASKFANWIADYYVSVNKDVAAGEIGLAGAYDSWMEGAWIGFYSPADVKAGEKIGLLESTGGTPWTYAEIVEFVGEFRCGAFDLNDACAGVTLKVELRLTNPEDANDIITVCVTEYTFA